MSGALHLALGALAEAKGYLAKALDVNPELEWAHYHSGIACERSGDTRSARTHYLEALKVRGGNQSNCLMAVTRLCALSLADGDLSSAQAWLKRGDSYCGRADGFARAALESERAKIVREQGGA